PAELERVRAAQYRYVVPGVYQRSRLLRSILEEEVADDQDAHGARKVPQGCCATMVAADVEESAGSASPCPTRRPAHFPLWTSRTCTACASRTCSRTSPRSSRPGRSRTALMWAGSRRRSPRT